MKSLSDDYVKDILDPQISESLLEALKPKRTLENLHLNEFSA